MAGNLTLYRQTARLEATSLLSYVLVPHITVLHSNLTFVYALLMQNGVNIYYNYKLLFVGISLSLLSLF